MGLLGVGWAVGRLHRRRLPKATCRELGRPLLSWIGLTLLLGLMIKQVDNWAHIGGTLLGMAAALVLDLRPLRREPRPWRRGLELGLAGSGLIALATCGMLMFRAHSPASHMVLRGCAGVGVMVRVPELWLADQVGDRAVEFRAPGVPAALRVDRLRPSVLPRPGQEPDWLLAASGGAKVLQAPRAVRTAAGDTAWRIVIGAADVQEWYVWFVGRDVIRVAGVTEGDRYRQYRTVFERAADSLTMAQEGGAP
jgi:hypothetical protein